MRLLTIALFALWSSLASAQGVIPVALAQQSDLNGRPLSGALLYIYQVGTVATPQNAFQDFGLTVPYPWPLRADNLGRIPMFYLANGQVHARLTDASGVVQFDYPNLQVIGPSSGSGGGGGGVDPTTIFSSGDFKWRPTSETLVGWVRANGQSIGTTSCMGCTGRTNTDTQSLYVYLWTNCSNAHCPVVGGRGATALADFNALKPLTLPDLRGRSPFGLDDMGAASAGRISNNNITSGGGDLPTTPAATGGENNHTMSATDLIAHNHGITDPGHAHTFTYNNPSLNPNGGVGGAVTSIQTSGGTFPVTTSNVMTGLTHTDTSGTGTPFNVMPPFMLGTWHIKLATPKDLHICDMLTCVRKLELDI